MFKIQNFIDSLPLMGEGMLTIFIVIIFISIFIYLLNFLTSKIGKKNK